jgi:hypothetical protein
MKKDKINHIPSSTTRFDAYDEKKGVVQVPFSKLKEAIGGPSEGGTTFEWIRVSNFGGPVITSQSDGIADLMGNLSLSIDGSNTYTLSWDGPLDILRFNVANISSGNAVILNYVTENLKSVDYELWDINGVAQPSAFHTLIIYPLS